MVAVLIPLTVASNTGRAFCEELLAVKVVVILDGNGFGPRAGTVNKT